MAIKMDRQVDSVDISFFVTAAATPGGIASVSTAGSGVALDNPSNVVSYAATASGAKPLGLLLNEFVDIDQTRTHVNTFKDQAVIGDKATLLTKGWVVTDRIIGSPAAGNLALLGHSGYIQASATGVANQTATPLVGIWRSSKDENGFAKLYVDL